MADLFGSRPAPLSAPSKLDVMNPAGTIALLNAARHLHLIKGLANNTSLVDRFAHQIALYAQLERKPEDTLRRFSLNGDNRLDFKEFQPALKRLFGHAITHGQARDLFAAFCPTSAKKLDIDTFCQIMAHWSSVAQRARDKPALLAPPTSPGNSVDHHANLRRGLELATLNYDKLSDMFLKMDVGCTGYLSKEEFELAMSHLGIYFTLQEYDQLYSQLPTSVLNTNGMAYAGFLSMLGIKMSALFQNQKVWESLLAHGDTLRRQLQLDVKRGQDTLAPPQLRELLSRCGLTLSNADFTALRMRLQPYSAATGEIAVTSLLGALNDKTAMLLQEPLSPQRRGKKMGHDCLSTSQAAGKTTEQRNAEAQHSLVKLPEHKPKSELAQTFLQEAAPAAATSPPNLEARIRQRLSQFQATGPTQFASARNVFPGDRLGRITRGQLRQALAQVGILSRHAEVEALFWKLDPTGRGFMTADDFCKHLQQDRVEVDDDAESDRPLRFEEQRFLDALENKVPELLRVCRRIDPTATGCLSKADFIWAMQEVGLLMSQSDALAAIAALSTRKDGVVAYATVPATLQVLHARRQRQALPLSNTALLLAPSPPSSPHPQGPSPTKYPDYPARRSSLTLGHDFSEPVKQERERDLTFALQPNPAADPRLVAERQERQASAKRMAAIHGILERRSDLKSCFDMYPYRPSAGGSVVLSLDAIVDILASARMNLDFATRDEARAFVHDIVPPGVAQLSFVEIIRLLNAVQHHDAAPSTDRTDFGRASRVEMTLRRKLAQESTLRDVSTHQWKTTGSIIVRHAFKGLASRDMTTTAPAGGQFDAACRNADLKHVCFRLSLDLTTQETNYLLRHMGAIERGSFTSRDLFDCFTALLFSSPHPTPAIA
ncbi:hypothetical protein ACHHYP_15808 [Achlya hypogyna]|uniref:EF-hand domain-containing protein n=1 Tax=Achlya hypogyna TaxID=1202772 RepID=A0A1V9ZF49_ACHHY|nr:hypothetical protein ACHHYP_15808 [Achlya hypogyna]